MHFESNDDQVLQIEVIYEEHVKWKKEKVVIEMYPTHKHVLSAHLSETYFVCHLAEKKPKSEPDS